ncbi:MAG: protein-L-isoaspartate(D-aspartate) O-methyltransferase [Acidobacteriota bacterium]|jgi:protein-L-isoaspartate(D-aspartate) O-methyltransferase
MFPAGSEKTQGSISPVEDLHFAQVRMRMVRNQLAERDVNDPRVLAAMLKVPRHRFVPIDLAASAYEDCPLPLMLGQTISQPYIVGHMTQALDLHGTERVLEIGTGSGYQAAVLADLASQVYTIEILPELAAQARLTLDELHYQNIHIRCGDGYSGWPDAAPFDRIIVTAAPDHVPQPLIDQLSIGGRLVIPVGRSDQELVVLEKTAAGLTRRSTIAVRFVPMTGRALARRVTGSV